MCHLDTQNSLEPLQILGYSNIFLKWVKFVFFFVVLTVLQRKVFRMVARDGSAKPVADIFRIQGVFSASIFSG